MKNDFIEKNMGLVHLCVKKFIGRGVDYDDLVQIASIGLIKASNNFDESRGLKFSTYAVPVIIGELKGYFRSDGIVKVSRRLKELATKINFLMENKIKLTGEVPTVSQIAIELNEKEEDIATAMCSCSSAISLTMTNENGESQLEIPVSSKEEEITDRLSLNQAINSLSENDKELITLRYYKNQTQIQVASVMGCSQVQISRREKKILIKLHSELG